MNGLNIFGFEIRKIPQAPSISPERNDDGALEQNVGSGAAHFGYAFDINKKFSNEVDLINRYRSISLIAEIDQAIEDITTEAIVVEEEKLPVTLEINATDAVIPKAIKEAIIEEHQNVMSLMKFNTEGHDLFRQWYVDGRISAQMLVDEQNLSDGIKDIVFIDPRKIKKVRDVIRERSTSGIDVVMGTNEYFLFNDAGINSSTNGVKISSDVMLYAVSGKTDESGNVISYLHGAIKPANNLRYMEDAVLIYTLARAPERRAFYIDVADMTKPKAEQYIRDVMNRYKNKIVYDQQTGEVKSDRAHASILEDYWLPRRCFSMSTKVKLLDGRDVSIQDLTDEYNSGKTNWTYSVSPEGNIVPGKITWAGVTMHNASVVDVHLDNGEIITCTPDHKFILRNGVECEAQNLVSGTSLMEYGMTDDGNIVEPATELAIDVGNFVEDYINDDVKYIDSISTLTIPVAVLKVVIREDKMDVGTLTVDGDETHHSYHNYALSAGVFVKNSNGRTTEITTLPGSSIMSQMDNVNYFLNKLYSALNLPRSRTNPDGGFMIGRSTEISRDEVKFSKFIARLRRKFSEIFYQALRAQLVLKGIIAPEDWPFIKSKLQFNFLRDNYFAELKENEILAGRIQMAEQLQPYVGKYYSNTYVQHRILKLSEEEAEQMEKELAVEMQEHPEWFGVPEEDTNKDEPQ